MSRARNRADGDFGDLDITNIGAVSLDSIKGDADGNTSLAFSGSDIITITTGGTAAASCKLIEKLGAEIIGCAFVVELDFLNGRKKLSKYNIHSLIHY